MRNAGRRDEAVMKKLRGIFRTHLVVSGALGHIFILWMAAGWPLGFDRWLIESDAPRRADYIVCLGGGLGGDNIPTEAGWSRIYTAVQLWFDGYAPKIVFTGGGTGGISESEVYAEFAAWLGCPKEALGHEVGAAGTADHPAKLLGTVGLGILRDSPLLIVTSPLHSRRAAMVFRKAGFTNFRMVTGWSARATQDPAKVRALRTSKFETFRPSGKNYGDVFNRLKWRTAYFFDAVREAAAILAYKLRGRA